MPVEIRLSMFESNRLATRQTNMSKPPVVNPLDSGDASWLNKLAPVPATGAAGDDPGGIAACSQAGARRSVGGQHAARNPDFTACGRARPARRE